MSSGDTSASSAPSPAAGWYPDPLDPTRERLWDGEQWSERARPAGTGAPPPAPPTPLPTPPLRRPSASHTPAVPSPPDVQRSGRGWSTGSLVGIGCGLVALLSLGGCVVLVGVVPLMAVRSEGGFVEQANEVAVAIPDTTMVAVPESMEEFTPTTAGPGMAVFGSSVETVAVLVGGEGAVFEVTVSEPVDLTDPVVDAGGSDLAPLDGEAVVGVPATVLLRDALDDRLPAAGLFEWTIVGGATGSEHQPVTTDSNACDVIDNDLTDVEAFIIGEPLRGVVCFLIPLEDFEHPQTQVVLEVVGGAPVTWIR